MLEESTFFPRLSRSRDAFWFLLVASHLFFLLLISLGFLYFCFSNLTFYCQMDSSWRSGEVALRFCRCREGDMWETLGFSGPLAWWNCWLQVESKRKEWQRRIQDISIWPSHIHSQTFTLKYSYIHINKTVHMMPYT